MPTHGKEVFVMRPGERMPIRVSSRTVDALAAAEGRNGYRFATEEEAADQWIHNEETGRTIDCPFDHPTLIEKVWKRVFPWRYATEAEIKAAKGTREKENKKRRKLDELRARERVRKATILAPESLTQEQIDMAEEGDPDADA